MNDCDHDWRWLPIIEYKLGPLGTTSEAYNAYCASCGERTWAHGHGPTNPIPTSPTTPTTERS